MKPLTCAFGTPWGLSHECAGCAAESARLEAEFQAGVLAGRWDREGYTAQERKIRQMKQLDLEWSA